MSTLLVLSVTCDATGQYCQMYWSMTLQYHFHLGERLLGQESKPALGMFCKFVQAWLNQAASIALGSVVLGLSSTMSGKQSPASSVAAVHHLSV